MSDWKPTEYLKFEKERTQPSIDLVARINHNNPKRIIDIGCGPGNSTNIVRSRWRDAEIIGLDSSAAMINKAKENFPEMKWHRADATGDLSALGKFDIVFSNAAIQWLPNQETLLPKLFGMLNKDGVLAVQVPYTKEMPLCTELIKLISGEKWKSHFADFTEGFLKLPSDFYYNILTNLTDDLALWETRYFHVMNTHSDIVSWYRGSGLRIYLDCIKDESLKADFLNDYEAALKSAYPAQSDGKILFPFTRIFFIARHQ